MLTWHLKHPKAKFEMLGYIPEFLMNGDDRTAVEQINDRYRHGGGWHSMKKHLTTGFVINDDHIRFPGEPRPRYLIAEAPLVHHTIKDLLENKPPVLRETIRVYEGAFVVIIQPDKSWDIARID